MPFVILLLAVFGWVAIRIHKIRRSTPVYVEYWVYLPEAKLPSQDEVMERLVRQPQNHLRASAAEALLFSDVRLHTSLVLRDKNPDLFIGQEDKRALARVRFESEAKVPDRRYLTLLPKLAATMAELVGMATIYDVGLDEHVALEDLASAPGTCVRSEKGGLRTWGLKKVGLPELQTDELPEDQIVRLTPILESFAEQAFHTGTLEGHNAKVKIAPPVMGVSRVEIDIP